MKKTTIILLMLLAFNVNIKADNQILVNKQEALEKEYKPEKLISPEINSVKYRVVLIDEAIKDDIEKMFEGAKKEGIELVILSGYRSYEYQKGLYNRYVKIDGKEKAETYVAIPGHSEHQTGLAVDLTSEKELYQLKETFGETEEGMWLANNAHKYGFILRYPKGKEEITGYMYEPWHFRHIGYEMAKDIYDKKYTFEEHLKYLEEKRLEEERRRNEYKNKYMNSNYVKRYVFKNTGINIFKSKSKGE